MTKVTRNIISIDEEKCNGCGLCVPACKEGALQIIDGKARLVSEIYCDGLGACLGECPQGAITIEERTAEAFDEEAVLNRKDDNMKNEELAPLPCGCPGTMAKSIGKKADTHVNESAEQRSELTNWPIQLMLVPPTAPYLKNADIVLLADCTAVAYANLHRDFIRNRVILMACPKLDNTEQYLAKLTHMIAHNNLRSIEVVMMEVPCCAGLGQLVKAAVQASGVEVRVLDTIIGIEGNKLTQVND